MVYKCVWGIRIPLTLLLKDFLGYNGIWIAIMGSNVIVGILVYGYYRSQKLISPQENLEEKQESV